MIVRVVLEAGECVSVSVQGCVHMDLVLGSNISSILC